MYFYKLAKKDIGLFQESVIKWAEYMLMVLQAAEEFKITLDSANDFTGALSVNNTGAVDNHISNASLGAKNPGVESIVISFIRAF